MAKSSILRKGLRITGVVLGCAALSAGAVVGYFAATEFRPEQVADVELASQGTEELSASKTYTALSWNIGYAGLGDNADFFMDGGQHARATSEDRLHQNLAAIKNQIAEIDADFTLLQEVDINSKRSYGVNEMAELSTKQTGQSSSFAHNFKVKHVPIPLSDPIGYVESGLLSFTKNHVTAASRVQLPIPFTWPESMFNLKRALLINRLPIAGSDKELVMINLHLEAYDDGAGKAAQSQMLMEIFAQEVAKGNYVVAGGDFNQTFPQNDGIYPVAADAWTPPELDATILNSGYQVVADASAPSCRALRVPYAGADPETFQHYLIDGFVVSNNVTVKQVKTLDLGFKAADHNPVQLEFVLNI